MSWEKIRFEELYLSPSRNGIYKSADSHGSGIKIVNMGEIFAYSFIGNQEMQRIALSKEEYERFGLQNGDLLFARRSLVESGAGKCSIVIGLNEPTTFESSIIRVRLDQDKCVPLFYQYWMRSHAGRTAIGALVSGTNVKGIRGTELKDIFVDYPDFAIQSRIANILKNYDDLIENNQRQIKLLEEAAQRLYNEWFVNLRFPGYENTPIVNGVPEGWTKGTLGDISIFKRGKTITKAQVQEGDVPVVAGGLEPAYYHNKSNTVAPVITVSGSGANAGFTRLYNVDVFASDCSYIDSNSTPFLFFVYCYLKANSMKLDSLQKGSAQPHVYAKDLNALALNVPTKELLTIFCNIVSSYFEQIRLLQRKNEISAEARDRLLPKLMSGEIEV